MSLLEDAAFLDEQGYLGESNANVTYVATMTEPEKWGSPGPGDRVIDKDMISEYVEDLTVPIYYLCGPVGMVKVMRSLLKGAGVDDDDIRTE